MTTRGMIAIPIEDGDAAIGVFHRYDAYPTGLGVALVKARQAHKDFRSFVRTLIFDHPAGWSEIVGADWSLDPSYVDHNHPDRLCVQCGLSQWSHYAQYYASRGFETPKGPILVHGHGFEHPASDHRPECYCHGDETPDATPNSLMCVSEYGSDICQGTDCDASFIEWVYRLYPWGIEVWGSLDWNSTSRHMRRGRVGYDDIAPATAFAAIEESHRDVVNEWAASMAELAEDLGRR